MPFTDEHKSYFSGCNDAVWPLVPGRLGKTVMGGNECKNKHVVRRIADTLGVDVADFYVDHGKLGAAGEALELFGAFERITDVNDRLRCLEFVNALAARQRLAEAL